MVNTIRSNSTLTRVDYRHEVERAKANSGWNDLKNTSLMKSESVLAYFFDSINGTKIADIIVKSRSKTYPIGRVTNPSPVITLRNRWIHSNEVQADLGHVFQRLRGRYLNVSSSNTVPEKKLVSTLRETELVVKNIPSE